MDVPVELHILSGAVAVAIQAHAVKLALQAGLGSVLGAVS